MRGQLDAARAKATEAEHGNSEVVKRLEAELKRAHVEIENASGTIESLRQALTKVDENNKEDEQKRTVEKEEDAKIRCLLNLVGRDGRMFREQYSIALENLKKELTEGQEKISRLSQVEAERDELSKKVDQLANEIQAKEQEYQQVGRAIKVEDREF